MRGGRGAGRAVPRFAGALSLNARLIAQGADAVAQAELQARLQDWRPELTGTLVFVLDTKASKPRVLLIDKKTGHGAGKINAPGGKLEPDESPLQCAQREVYEEVGLRVAHARLAAELKFVDTQAPQWFGYAFVADEFAGVPKETREARPFWCDLDALPYARMWEDDRFWLPLILPTPETAPVAAGQKVAGEFLFTRGKLLAYRCYVRSAACA